MRTRHCQVCQVYRSVRQCSIRTFSMFRTFAPGGQMTQWRIRLMVPEADVGRRALRIALAQAPVTGVRLATSGAEVADLTGAEVADLTGAEVADLTGAEVAELTGDVIIELGEDEALGDLLRALHDISPQVFISRVTSPEADPDQPIKVRKLAPIGAVRG